MRVRILDDSDHFCKDHKFGCPLELAVTQLRVRSGKGFSGLELDSSARAFLPNQHTPIGILFMVVIL